MENQRQKLEVLFNTFKKYPLEQLELNIYAIADAAQDKRFLKSLDHLKQQCLLVEAAGEKAREISPHLLQLPRDFEASEWNWIAKNVAGTTGITLIISDLPFELLFDHLRQFLEVKFEGGLEMMLAFWDPVILATLVGNATDKTLYVQGPVLDAQQIENLLKPIQSWWYWDRLGNIQAIFGLNEKTEDFSAIATPLHLTAEQEEMLVEATFPDNLIYYLKLNNAFLVDEIDDYELYQFVMKTIPEAREYKLEGTRDILNFISIKLIYKEKFSTDAELQTVLSQLKNQQIMMDDAMKALMSKAG